ncbi:hypothetical protein OM999_04650 [Mycoplasmopsis cynos]|uniref:hypothetical protein n=1 Tax=Mycoplasmopsis cynos TaxID=171284 RepID=UPI0024C65869|nr:hypothetical protein OM999_04650 [Mycoplasmopsis cynos]
MTKKRIKKLLFPLFASSLSIFCVAGLISCKPTKERDPEEMRKELFVKRVHNSAIDYDFGLAPILLITLTMLDINQLIRFCHH